jgi:SAM-dependent methyltransferase
MGIAKSAFNLLLKEKKGGFLKGKVLQLGRQHTFLTFPQALSLAQAAGVSLPNADSLEIRLSFKEDLKKSKYIDDITLFSLLGFDEVHSLDASSFEGATLIYDLNVPIPKELHNQYDVIYDGGTMEHIFSVPNVLQNIHDLLKEGGIVIHASPSHNHVDHGFYMFSPTLFTDYYMANAYQILSSYIFQYSDDHNRSWNIYQYEPGSLDGFSFGGFGKEMLGIWFIAQKTSRSTSSVIPQQGAYVKQWRSEIPSAPKSSFSFLRSWIKKSKRVHSLARKTKKILLPLKLNRLKLKKIR